jgi:hypothetical protein
MTRRLAQLGRATGFAFLCSWTACAGGSETGNPVLPTEIALSVRSSDPGLIAVSEGAQGSVLSEAWIAFGDVAFLNEEQCAMFGEIEGSATTLVIANLARAGVVISIDAEPDGHCGMVVPLPARNDVLPSGAPDELRGNSIVLRGERADGTPFLLTHPEHDDLELEATDGVIDALDRTLLLSFDVAVWMRDVDLDGATVGDDGVIHINGAENTERLDRFEVNLECSLELYADGNGDGSVDASDELLAKCFPDGEDG